MNEQDVVRQVTVTATRWRVEGAPAPTLIVASQTRVLDPVVVLGSALAAAPVDVLKVALLHPAERSDVDAEYFFAQVVRSEGGVLLDLSAECGHSMTAAAASLVDSRQTPQDVVPSVTLVSHRSGSPRLFECQVRAKGDAFEVDLSFPLHDEKEQFPLGQDPVPAGAGFSATVVDEGNLYAFVPAGQLGIDTPEELYSAGPDVSAALRDVRATLAPQLGVDDSKVLPKPALLLEDAEGDLHMRALSADDWHPALALTGLVALAAKTSADAPGPRHDEIDLEVVHPSGVSQIAVRETSRGAVVVLSGVQVQKLRSPR